MNPLKKEVKKMNKADFINMFESAKEYKSTCVFVEITAEGIKEVIVIPRESFDDKQNFYSNAYDDELVHVMNKNVKITSFSHGNIKDLDNHIEGGDNT